MDKHCVKCGHKADITAAQAIDQNLACPACGAVYAKVEAMAAQRAGAAPTAAVPRRSAQGKAEQVNVIAAKSRSRGPVLLAGSAALVLVAAYWYWSPYWALHQMRKAAMSGDARKVSESIDYPALRDNVKGQISAKLGPALTGTSNPFAALGTMMGLAMVNQLVDATIRPEPLMQAISSGRLRLQRDLGAASTPQPTFSKATWHYERESVDRLIVYPADVSRSEAAGFVFTRTGFANWRLTEINLPNP